MNEIKSQARPTVRTSARDPIAQWLDVFTKLLALPSTERDRIRDELEDHLRMRVDDLMILGLSEPEAVEKAVSELGETAELAKRFKEARTSTRRRRLMQTTMFATAGLAITIGAMNLMPGGALPAPSTPAIVDAQPEPEILNESLDRDLPAGTLGEMLQMIAETGNSRLFVHWSSLESLGLTADTEVRAIPAKGLDYPKVRQLLSSALGLEGLDELDARVEGDLVEIGTVGYFDRIETVLMDYDISSLVDPTRGPQWNRNISRNRALDIHSVIEPQIWQRAMGSVVQSDSTLTVRAPKRVHAQIQEYLARLEERQKIVEAEYLKEVQERNEKSKAAREAQAAQIQQSIHELIDQVEEHQRAYQRISHDYWELTMDIQDEEQIYAFSEDEAQRRDAKNRLIAAQVRLESIVATRERLQSQIDSGWNQIDAWELQLNSLQHGLESDSP